MSSLLEQHSYLSCFDTWYLRFVGSRAKPWARAGALVSFTVEAILWRILVVNENLLVSVFFGRELGRNLSDQFGHPRFRLNRAPSRADANRKSTSTRVHPRNQYVPRSHQSIDSQVQSVRAHPVGRVNGPDTLLSHARSSRFY